MADTSGLDEPIIIKKYANRRLYDTSSSSYVTLEHLSELVRSGKDFVVLDAKSGEDLTRSVLTQIIFEQENKGGNALPLNFLRQVIRFYGDSVSQALPPYLDMAMNNFTKNQERWRGMMSGGMPANPMAMFEDQARRNAGEADAVTDALDDASDDPVVAARDPPRADRGEERGLMGRLLRV